MNENERNEPQLSALFVTPIADLLRRWTFAGKLDEDDLERTLSANAQALVDHPMDPADWAQLADVEGMVGLVASELGGEAGLVEWSEEIVAEWVESGRLATLLQSARGLVDAEGFMVSQASGLFVRNPSWEYAGNASEFNVRVGGVGEASPALKALLGGFLSRLAEQVSETFFDVRVAGVDASELVIFGEAEDGMDHVAENRLHRAALVP